MPLPSKSPGQMPYNSIRAGLKPALIITNLLYFLLPEFNLYSRIEIKLMIVLLNGYGYLTSIYILSSGCLHLSFQKIYMILILALAVPACVAPQVGKESCNRRSGNTESSDKSL